MDENFEGDDNEPILNPNNRNPRGEEEEEEDDFPEYANEQNKQLNQIIKEKRKLIKELTNKIEERSDRLKILTDHLKNVQSELLHTQSLIDVKNKEIEGEDHLKQITERQIGRLESELRKLEKLGIEEQERLNDIQNQIFRGNEKMDKFKVEVHWNQEELEQWALAARQKEEDNITLEKYKRADETKIKELNLQIERLTIEVGRIQNDLEREITETQAAQIELDKTAEEFKRHHEERHRYFLQWQEVLSNINRREKVILEEGETFAKVKLEINNTKQNLEERKNFLKREKLDNKSSEMNINSMERKIVEERGLNKKTEESLLNTEAEVEIKKNQLSAFASELANKKMRCANLSQDLLQKKQRLNIAQKKYHSQIAKMKSEEAIAEQYRETKEEAEQRYKKNEQEKKDLEKKIRLEKDKLVKTTQDLFKQRELEANLYGEIQGTMAACRNLQSHINKLNQEFQRQQELLYNAEYQIQLLERKVAWAKGERTLEEKKDLENESRQVREKMEEVNKDHKLLTNSMKKLEEDLRTVERKLTSTELEKKKYVSLIEELTLENDMTYQDLNKIIKSKEDVLVQHDIMKLEIKKIRDRLSLATDQVFNLENEKYQLEMSMQAREKEIQVHRDVLVAEDKAAEEERHKIAVELAERKNKVKNLKIKYESLVQKNKASNGEIESVNEHSQAYYVIKAAQEREELQRKGDELNAKIAKSQSELDALDNTLNHLKTRNSNYRDSFLNKGVTDRDLEYKNALEDQCKIGSQTMFKKQKELTQVQKEFDEDMRRFTEVNNKIDILSQQMREEEMNQDKIKKELIDQDEKMDRAKKSMNSKMNNAKKIKANLTDTNPHIIQMSYDIENNLTKTLLSVLYNISIEYPELGPLLEQTLKSKNLTLPSKPPSSIDLQSQKSSSSSRR